MRLRGEATTAPGMVAVAAAASVLFCVCATGCGQRGAASHPAGLTAEEAAFQQRLQEQLLDARPGTVIEIAPGKHLLDRVLTLRADTLGRHSGQISLPGGVIEPGEAYEEAALREAHEEIAVAARDVRVLGALTPIDIPVSGFRLHPIVGVSEARPAFAPADGEVARILDVAVDDLMAPGAVVSASRERDGRPVVVPAFRVAGVEIWGATAMVLAEFLVVLGWSRAGC